MCLCAVFQLKCMSYYETRFKMFERQYAEVFEDIVLT